MVKMDSTLVIVQVLFPYQWYRKSRHCSSRIMSMGVPIIAWDIKEWLDQGEAYRVPATSIPYWDERCGEVFFNIDELEETFSKFYATIDEYDPKAFVKDNLSFECSVKTLLNILL